MKLGENEASHLGDDGYPGPFLFWHLEAGCSHGGSGLVGSPGFLAQLLSPSGMGDLGSRTMPFRHLRVYCKLLLAFKKKASSI